MEQERHQKQNQEQLPFSELLRQSIINQPYDLATLCGRAWFGMATFATHQTAGHIIHSAATSG